MFKTLNKDPICFKNPEKLSSIDVTLTNSPYRFQNSFAIESGLSEFYKMRALVMKPTFQKFKPKIIYYRNFTRFCNENCRKTFQ